MLLALGYALNPDGTRAAIAEHVQQRDTQGQYVVDGNGEPVLDATRTTSYQHDKTKRLIEEAVTAANADHQRTTGWSYDKVGNRLSQAHTVPGGTTVPANATTTSYSYDSNDRPLQESAVSNGVTRLTTHRYDLNGSLTETATPEQTMFYRYNSQNRMVQAERKIGSVLDITQYSYTADGIRRSQVLKAGTVDAREIRYLIDRNQAYAQVIEERVGTPLAAGANVSGLNLKTAYTYGDDLLGQYALRDASGTVLPGAATAAIASTFHYDGLGSTRLLTGDTGNTIDSYAYGAFGEIDRNTSALATSDAPATDYQYTGEQHDPNLGFYYLRARYMDPSNGRFTQQDTFAGHDFVPASLHKFTYASVDPTNGIDPSGYETLLSMSVANNVGSNLALIAIGYAISCSMEYGLTSTFGAPTTPTPTFGCRSDNKKTYYHYSSAPLASFVRGLWSGSAATTVSGMDNVTASQKLGVPLPIFYEYPVTINPNVTRVSPVSFVPSTDRFFGGGTQVFFPAGTPPGSVGPPKPVLQVRR